MQGQIPFASLQKAEIKKPDSMPNTNRSACPSVPSVLPFIHPPNLPKKKNNEKKGEVEIALPCKCSESVRGLTR